MSNHFFPALTIDEAPEASRPILAESARRFGAVHPAQARHAHAPAVLEGFQVMHELFERTSLHPLEREAVIMTVARINRCGLCVRFHTAILAGLDAPAGLAEALAAGEPPADAKLAAIAHFTEQVLAGRGQVAAGELEAFVAAGFTPRQALEVVVGIATYTLSTFANRMTGS